MKTKVYRLAFTPEEGLITDSTFYIGITCNELMKRFKEHTSINSCISSTNKVISDFHNNVKEIYIIEIFEFNSDSKARKKEDKLIHKYREQLINIVGNDLLNGFLNPYNNQCEIMWRTLNMTT